MMNKVRLVYNLSLQGHMVVEANNVDSLGSQGMSKAEYPQGYPQGFPMQSGNF